MGAGPPRLDRLFQPGERVRLRIINASSMTIFDVRIPGLEMDVVQTDGHDVHAVTVAQFRIGVAETYDVIIQPKDDRAYTLFAQAQDRSGYARATLAPRFGMAAVVPPMDPRPVRTMVDMGMSGMSGMPKMKGMAMKGQMGGMTPSPVPSGEVAGSATPALKGAPPAMAADMQSMSGISGMDMSHPGAAAEAHGGAATQSASGVMPMKMAATNDPARICRLRTPAARRGPN